MRASRLLSILLLLQARGRMTAGELAAELEVSPRTVYRDVEALGAAGVPVYADRGPAGGYRLLEGFRTRVNGLTGDEADALFLAALPGEADSLGLGAAVASAELKVLAGLPPSLRGRAARVRERFLVDAPGWYRDAEGADAAPHLAAVASAVWEERRVRMRYRRWGGEVLRTVDPHGLVLKGGAWYVVARPAGDEDTLRTYRVARVLELGPCEGAFVRVPGFDLAGFWEGFQREAEQRIHPLRVSVRLSPQGVRLVGHLLSAFAHRTVQETASPPDAQGWVVAELPVASVGFAVHEVMRLGTEVEVLGPPEVRRSVALVAEEIAARHRI